jgi:L-ascorbate metabolism protein UlaG (beta-lactamase superfamily)
MRITKYAHACLLVEEGGARLLLDPGMFSAAADGLGDLDAVLLTHQHADHLDLDRVAALAARNPDAVLVADRASAERLGARGLRARAVADGDELDLGGVTVRVAGAWHAVIHPDLPPVPNVGYLVGGRLFHPGDAFTDPPAAAEVLAVPVGAPWLKLQEAVDYVRRAAPRAVVPVHERVLAIPQAAYRLLAQLAGDAEVRDLDDGTPLEL